MARPKSVTIGEVGPRDGLQNEATFIPTEAKIKLINGLIGAGVPEIEVTSFVSPRAVPQLRDAAEVIAGIDRPPGTVVVALVPNDRGAARAIDAGVDEIRVFISASESHNQKNLNGTIAESLLDFEQVMRLADAANIPVSGAISTAFGCPFEGDVPVAQVGKIARHFCDLGMHSVSLGDTTGMATPPLVSERCRYLKEHLPQLPITLHFHNTRGLGLVNVMTGLDEGIDRFEASVAGLGGCPFAAGATGNVCTEDLVFMLQELGISTGIDLERLCEVARNFERLLDRPLPGQVMRAGPRLRLSNMDMVATATG